MPYLFFFLFRVVLTWDSSEISRQKQNKKDFGRFATELKITKYIFSSGQKFFES